MTLNSFAPQAFGKAAIEQMGIASPWTRFIGNKAPEILQAGATDRITFVDYEGSVGAPSDYTTGPLTWGSMSDDVITLLLDQKKTESHDVGQIDLTQKVYGSMAAQMSRQQSRQILLEYAKHIRSKAQNTTTISTTGNAPQIGGVSALNNKVDIDVKATGGTGSQVEFDTANYRARLVKEFGTAWKYATKQYWPQENRVAIVPADIWQQLYTYLSVDKPNLGAGSIVDDALTGARVPKIMGWDVYIDPDAADLSIADAGTNRSRISFLSGGRSVYAAIQLQTARVLEREDYFGQSVKSFWIYGAIAGPRRYNFGIVHNTKSS